jgi:hypothetical protein
MSIEHLGRLFKKVNPYHGYNPEGNCKSCAVETARALVEGRPPQTVDVGAAKVKDQGGQLQKTFAGTQANRAQAVLDALKGELPAGVYAVDADNHAYNFIVLPYNRQVFLIDSNQRIYRQISGVDDFVAKAYNVPLREPLVSDYNYGDPRGKKGKDMDFFFWGALDPYWLLELSRGGDRLSYGLGGSATFG